MDSIGKALQMVVATAAVKHSQCLPSKRQNEPPLIDKEADYNIPARVWSNWTPRGGQREIVRALTDEERVVLQRRVDILETALLGGYETEPHIVDAVLLGMFSGFPAMRQQDENAESRVAILRVMMREFPDWAIVKGCALIARGATDLDRHWPPSDADICNVVRRVVAPYSVALKNAQDLLKAPVELPPPPRPVRVEHVSRPVNEQKREDWRDGRGEVELPPSDGKHMERVMADIAQRKARKAEQEQSNG